MSSYEIADGNGAVIVFDFDGVINSYESGYTKDTLPDPPVEGVREFLVDLRAANWKVIVSSARMSDGDEAYDMIQDYLYKWGIVVDGLQWGKPKAKIYVDDRAFHFKTNYPKSSMYELARRTRDEADDVYFEKLEDYEKYLEEQRDGTG